MLSFETTCAFFVASLLMAMTPGPDVIIVLTQSSLYGMRAGVLTTLGLMTGLLGHTLAVALGVAVRSSKTTLSYSIQSAIDAVQSNGQLDIIKSRWVGQVGTLTSTSMLPGLGASAAGQDTEAAPTE